MHALAVCMLCPLLLGHSTCHPRPYMFQTASSFYKALLRSCLCYCSIDGLQLLIMYSAVTSVTDCVPCVLSPCDARCRQLAVLEEEEELLLTPLERNLEVWRQLWRVLERSDIVVQVRQPALIRSGSCEQTGSRHNNLFASTVLVQRRRFAAHSVLITGATAYRCAVACVLLSRLMIW
eukprot:GHRQ01030481.1.p1 GENE.GHRQ01030481.1~~GHRQ01030481.1.p1  ORF type:complete len:195 (-),score=29.31 GHRQ01030481.1:573-1106(-)